MKFKQLSLEEREKLFGLKIEGLSFREIGRRLGRSHATISREWHNRAKYGKKYLPCKAQALATKIAVNQRTKAPLKNPKTFLYVRQKLRAHWTPEEIAGRLPIDHPGLSISYETIYRYIYNKKKTTKHMKLWRYLPNHRKKRMKKHGRKVQSPPINKALPLEQRPQEVTTRKSFGHWETDNLGGKISDKTTVSGTIERKSRVVHLNKLADKTSITKMKMVKSRISKLPQKGRQTLTIDGGPENAKHRQLKRTFKSGIYSCNPYHSWEKGTVENMFGRTRRFIPKGTSLDKVSQKQIKYIENWLNNTPRKCLAYKTPNEIMQQELKLLKIQGGAIQV